MEQKKAERPAADLVHLEQFSGNMAGGDSAGPREARLSALSSAMNRSPAVQRLSTLATVLNGSPAAQRLKGMAAGGDGEAGLPAAGRVAQRALVKDAEILDERRGAAYSWMSFRGKRTEEPGGGAIERGRGAKTETGRTWKSKIEWDPVHADSGEGTRVRATIGPDHNLGSAPSLAAAKNRVDAFKALSKKSYISGHLLNEKLGGPGDDARNLTAISGEANTTEAEAIEKFVRDPVNEEGRWMRYGVVVSYTQDSSTGITEKKKKKVAGYGAKGVSFEQEGGKSTYKVTVHYANNITASWYTYDQDGKAATKMVTKSMSMASPLAGGAPGAINERTSGDATKTPMAKTNIDAEELVLTTSKLLKHIVDSRKPLVERIKTLRDNVAVLKGDMDEAQAAYALLMKEAMEVGRQAGYEYGRNTFLAKYDLAAAPREPVMMDGVDEYEAAFKEGMESGKKAAEDYLEGYNAGYDQGWSDLPSDCDAMNDDYQDGYQRGHTHGLEAGDYSSGRRYVFNNIALLSNIFEWKQNIFIHGRGAHTVEIVGEPVQTGAIRWYPVRLISSACFDYEGYGDRTFWMKRAWLNKGF